MCIRGCLKVRCDNPREVPVIKEKWIAFVKGHLIVEALHCDREKDGRIMAPLPRTCVNLADDEQYQINS